MCRIEYFVRPHEGDEVLSFTQIDDVVRISGQHVDGLDAVAADFKFDHFVGSDLSFLD